MRLAHLLMASGAHGLGPRRVLLLHGSGGSADIFQLRGAKPLIDAAKARYHDRGPAMWEFDAIDAGNDDGVWWTYPKGQRSFTADAYTGAEESIEAVESALVDGGFCGLVGFSQGAILGSIIAARAALGEGVSGLRFAVLCSGAVPKPYAPTLDRLRAAGGGGSVRTLHCLSAIDTMNPPEQGEALAAAFGPSAEVLWHDGGHAMPPPGEALKRTAEFLDRAYADGGG